VNLVLLDFHANKPVLLLLIPALVVTTVPYLTLRLAWIKFYLVLPVLITAMSTQQVWIIVFLVLRVNIATRPLSHSQDTVLTVMYVLKEPLRQLLLEHLIQVLMLLQVQDLAQLATTVLSVQGTLFPARLASTIL
jgi:hypothetical protein